MQIELVDATAYTPFFARRILPSRCASYKMEEERGVNEVAGEKGLKKGS